MSLATTYIEDETKAGFEGEERGLSRNKHGRVTLAVLTTLAARTEPSSKTKQLNIIQAARGLCNDNIPSIAAIERSRSKIGRRNLPAFVRPVFTLLRDVCFCVCLLPAHTPALSLVKHSEVGHTMARRKVSYTHIHNNEARYRTTTNDRHIIYTFPPIYLAKKGKRVSLHRFDWSYPQSVPFPIAFCIRSIPRPFPSQSPFHSNPHLPPSHPTQHLETKRILRRSSRQIRPPARRLRREPTSTRLDTESDWRWRTRLLWDKRL